MSERIEELLIKDNHVGLKQVESDELRALMTKEATDLKRERDEAREENENLRKFGSRENQRLSELVVDLKAENERLKETDGELRRLNKSILDHNRQLVTVKELNEARIDELEAELVEAGETIAGHIMITARTESDLATANAKLGKYKGLCAQSLEELVLWIKSNPKCFKFDTPRVIADLRTALDESEAKND